MSEMIRKITGIGASTNVNYIPVVYYCVCDTDADILEKEIKWIGKVGENSNIVNSSNIKLYEGLTLAVLFKKGILQVTDDVVAFTPYKIKIGNNFYEMLLDNNNKVRGAKENTVVCFEYDGTNFRVINGLLPYLFEEFKEKINDEIGSLNDSTVKKEADVEHEGGYKEQTGDENKFIYVNDGAVRESVSDIGDDKTIDDKVKPIWIHKGTFKEISSTVGKDTENNIRPIWMDKGNISEFTENVGSNTNNTARPIYITNGSIKPITANIGKDAQNDIVPIYVNGGTITAISQTSGSTARPVYIDNGIIKPITASRGSSSNPVYFNNGTITEATGDFGGDVAPLKMIGGKLTPVAKDLATQEGLNAEITRATGAEQTLQSAVDSAAHDIKLTSDNNDYKYTFQLKDKNGNLIGNSITINLPLETMVTSGTYSDGVISLILQNGNSITFPVVDLQNGLVKDSGANGEGDDAHPIYVNSSGIATSTSYNLADFAKSADLTTTYKKIQTAVTDPIASGSKTAFISSISQDAQGKITVTKANVSFPGSYTPSAHTHSTDDITAGTLPIARGGTGLSTNPSLLTNLGSTTAATVFQASPRPGITGTLGIGNGGTGATSAADARTNLGLKSAATYASTTFASASHNHAWSEITGTPANATLNYYHTSNNYTLAASNATSGLKATMSGSGVGAITLNVPVYWGTSTPTLTGTTGAIYIQIQ